MVAAGPVIPFLFVQVYTDGSIFELLGDYLLLPHELKQLMELLPQSCATFFVDLRWDRF